MKAKHDDKGRLLANAVRCPWCGRQSVRLKRGRLAGHVSPGNVRCIGSGQVYASVFARLEQGAQL